MNWKSWLQGLFFAIAAGVGGGLTFALTDPEHFNFGNGGGMHLLSLSIAFGLLAAGGYLKDSRPPSWKDSIPTVADLKKGAGVGVILLACALGAGAMTLPACASVQTHVSPVADIANAAGKVEESAHVILVEAQKANQIPNPLKPGELLVNRGNLDRVAIAVNKLGHLGLDLDAALGDYNAAKAAGKDLTAVRAVVSKALADISTALGDVGEAIPNGTLAAVDQAVGSILGILATVKGVVGL
jgi:hypothetical protein